MRCYETFELSFQGEAPKGSHAEVALSAVLHAERRNGL